MRKTLFALLSLGISAPAFSAGFVDARLASGSYEIDDDFDNLEAEEATGFDLRAQFDATENVFFRTEYLSSNADEVELNGTDFDVDFDVDTLRGGVGLQAGDTFKYYGAIEYAQLEFELDGVSGDDDGFILSGGFKDAGKTPFLWNVELGLIQYDDSDGAAFEFSLGYRFNETIALVGGGQGYSLEDSGAEFDITHVTLGARVSF